MQITYIYHSGFWLESEDAVVVIDYWRDGLRDVASLVAATAKQVYVLASHVHPDHFNLVTLTWTSSKPIRYILSADIRRRHKEMRDDGRITWLHRGEEYGDELVKIRALGSTDVGVSWLVTLDGKRIFHAGDFNDWIRDESSEEDNRRMHNYFVAELNKMREAVAEVDVAMFPADPHLGSHIADGAEQFCEAVRPKMLIPMHCWECYDEAGMVGKAVRRKGAQYVDCREVDNLKIG